MLLMIQVIFFIFYMYSTHIVEPFWTHNRVQLRLQWEYLEKTALISQVQSYSPQCF